MTEFLETQEFVKELFRFLPEWITKYEIAGISNNGSAGQHTDYGVTQLNLLYPLKDKSIIELGSQEAAHTIMMHNFGAKKIIGLEGRISSYTKCCIIKNIYDLNTTKFYSEDLRTADLTKFGLFDVCLCSGILYHLPNPQDLISKISKVAPRILINTHYANDIFPSSKISQVTLNNKSYNGKIYDEINVDHPNSGFQRNSFWFLKDELIQILKDVGYQNFPLIKDWWKPDDVKKELAAVTIYAEK